MKFNWNPGGSQTRYLISTEWGETYSTENNNQLLFILLHTHKHKLNRSKRMFILDNKGAKRFPSPQSTDVANFEILKETIAFKECENILCMPDYSNKMVGKRRKGKRKRAVLEWMLNSFYVLSLIQQMSFGFLRNKNKPELGQIVKLFPTIKYENRILVLLISVHIADSTIFL